MNRKLDVVVLSSGANGLGAVRALSRAGLAVGALAESPDDISLHSNTCAWRGSLDAGDRGPDAVLRRLNDLKDSGAVIIPTSDRMVSALSENRDELEQAFSLCLPPRGLVELCIDKAQEVQKVRDVVPIPKTLLEMPETPAELIEQLALPIIVKPRSHKHFAIGAKNIIIRDARAAEEFYREFYDVKDSVIAQEMIPGPDSNQVVCNCVFDRESGLASAFTFRRLSLSPAHRGVTSYAVSERNEDVVELSKKLGKALGFVGPAMLEFKQSATDGEYKYIELNPRLGLCNGFDAFCGVNNVLNAYRVTRGLEPTVAFYGRSGVYLLSLYEDMYSRLKDGDGVMKTLAVYARNMFKPHAFLFFDLRDPLPAIHVGMEHSKRLLIAAVKRLRRLFRPVGP